MNPEKSPALLESIKVVGTWQHRLAEQEETTPALLKTTPALQKTTPTPVLTTAVGVLTTAVGVLTTPVGVPTTTRGPAAAVPAR